MANTQSSFVAWLSGTLLIMTLGAGAAFADTHDRVVAQMRDGKLREALASSQRHLAKHPHDVRMRFLKGVLQQESGQHAAAIATYQRLAREQPGLPEPHYNLALLYLARGQPEKASEAFESAKRISRSHAVTYDRLGGVFDELATQSYAAVIQLADGDPKPANALSPIRQIISLPTFSGATTLEPTRTPRVRNPSPAP